MVRRLLISLALCLLPVGVSAIENGKVPAQVGADGVRVLLVSSADVGVSEPLASFSLFFALSLCHMESCSAILVSPIEGRQSAKEVPRFGSVCFPKVEKLRRSTKKVNSNVMQSLKVTIQSGAPPCCSSSAWFFF